MFSLTEIILLAMFVFFVAAMVYAIQGPPFVPSNDDDAAEMLGLAKGCKPRRVLDMGSGDGKLVILLARRGYIVDGVEIKPWLVWRSRRAIKRAGLAGKASVRWGNFWSFDVSEYDLVTLYAVMHIMRRLEKKLVSELPSGAYVVSNSFTFPTLKPVKSTKHVRAYKIP